MEVERRVIVLSRVGKSKFIGCEFNPFPLRMVNLFRRFQQPLLIALTVLIIISFGVFFNLPSRPYRHADPDKYRLPLKNDVIPFDFSSEHSYDASAYTASR